MATSTRIRRRLASPARPGDAGFTLVEILIVIVILGVLATVTVFAVSGIKDQGEDSVCAADHKTLETALSSFQAQQPPGALISEADLVAQGYLHSESELYDVDTSGGIVPQVDATTTCP